MFFASVAFILSFAFIFPVFKPLKRRDLFINIAMVFENLGTIQGLCRALRKFYKTICVVMDRSADYNLALHFRPRRQVLLQPRVISVAHLGSRVTRLMIVVGVRRVDIIRAHCANTFISGYITISFARFHFDRMRKIYTRRDRIALRCFRRAYL